MHQRWTIPIAALGLLAWTGSAAAQAVGVDWDDPQPATNGFTSEGDLDGSSVLMESDVPLALVAANLTGPDFAAAPLVADALAFGNSGAADLVVDIPRNGKIRLYANEWTIPMHTVLSFGQPYTVLSGFDGAPASGMFIIPTQFESFSGILEFDGPWSEMAIAFPRCAQTGCNPQQLITFGLAAAADTDTDGIPDVDDNCPMLDNEDQADFDGDGLGDPCDPDVDGDGIDDEADNCPFDPNPDQDDADGDGTGDVCDTDTGNDLDGDGVLDNVDACLPTATGEVVDARGCSIADLCPCDNDWRNHGAYVSCTSKAASKFRRAGLISKWEQRSITTAAARSQCGIKPKPKPKPRKHGKKQKKHGRR